MPSVWNILRGRRGDISLRSVRCEHCRADFVLELPTHEGGKVGEQVATDPSHKASTSLICRVQADEPGAWERLVDLYAPLVYRWCRRAGIQADDVPNVVQEVFVAVAGHVREFRRDRPGDYFRGWLCSVARPKINDRFRCLRGRTEAESGTEVLEQMTGPPDPLSGPSSGKYQIADEDLLAHRTVELVRAEVNDRIWQAFWRVAVQGADAAQVAANLSMNVRTVYEANYRVRRRIRQELVGLE